MENATEIAPEAEAPEPENLEAPDAEPEAPAEDAPAEEEPVDLQAQLEEATGGQDGDEDAPEGDDGEGEASPDDDPDIVEIEWAGKPIRATKEVAEKIGEMNAHFTQRFQENSAKARELESQATEFAEREKSYQEDLDYHALKMARMGEIQQFANVNWDSWYQEDPSAAGAAQARWRALEQEVNAIDQHLAQRAHERTEATQRDTAKRLQETSRWASENIQGWSPDTEKQTIGFAIETLGFSPDQLRSALNPAIMQTLHYARLGHQVLNKPAAPAKPKASPPKPTSTVKPRGNATARKSLADMDMTEYVKARKAGRNS